MRQTKVAMINSPMGCLYRLMQHWREMHVRMEAMKRVRGITNNYKR
jgi:hypothetical protein